MVVFFYFPVYYDAEFYGQQQHMGQNIHTLDLSFELMTECCLA